MRLAKSFTITDQASVNLIEKDDLSSKIVVQNGILYGSRLNEDVIDIFSSDGKLVYHGKSQDIYIGHGLFIIKVRNNTYKILSTIV